MDDDETPIAYIIVVRFDKEDNLLERVKTWAPRLVGAIKELGPSEQVAMSYDGSMCAYLVRCNGLAPAQVRARLEAPHSGRGAGIDSRDRLLIIDVGRLSMGTAKVIDWLSKHAS